MPYTKNPLFRCARASVHGLLWILVSSAADSASITSTVVDTSDAPVTDAVIFAILPAGTPSARITRDTSIEQIKLEFVPFVTPAQTGTLISFPNRDQVRHHVYSFSPAKTFELKLYVGTTVPQVLFDKPGPVVLGCNIHDHMLAYIYVVETPYFAKTAAGSARIDGIPAGDYELRAWHPRLRGALHTQRIKLGTEGSHAVRIVLDLAPQPIVGPRPPGKSAP